MMIYILNPGDGLDVETFTDRAASEKAHLACPGLSRLYSFAPRGGWREFSCQGSWWPTNRDNLPVKVLEAAK